MRDIITLKYGPNGALRWLARGTAPATPIFGRNVVLDGRGNAFVAGEGRTAASASPSYQLSQTMKFNRLGQRVWLVGQKIGPGPGAVAGLALNRRHDLILGGSDEVNYLRPVDLHLVNYVEKPGLANPHLLGRVTMRQHGTNVVLEVKAFGRGRLHYEWFRDGLPVFPREQAEDSSATRKQPKVHLGSRILIIPKVPASAGEYYVEVSNAHGAVVSETVRIGLPSLDGVSASQNK